MSVARLVAILRRDQGVQKNWENESKIVMGKSQSTRTVLEAAAGGDWAARCQLLTPNGKVWSVLDGDKIRVLHDGSFRKGIVVDKTTRTYYRTLQIARRHLSTS